MALWTRQNQEHYNQKYLFNGNLFVTAGIKEELTPEEVAYIYADVRQFAEEQKGIDYLQVFKDEKGRKVWIIDQLDKNMIESGDYSKEDNHCTLLFPEER
jgi:hypothetical protein